MVCAMIVILQRLRRRGFEFRTGYFRNGVPGDTMDHQILLMFLNDFNNRSPEINGSEDIVSNGGMSSDSKRYPP